ncbi:hypothetical protein MXB_1436 [Myxobolus squamalis]|nr:hypothetical protein MXB_1436 [Myxobolus squamalis]
MAKVIRELSHNNAPGIYNSCSCCDFYYTLKYLRLHKTKAFSCPKVRRKNWHGRISSKFYQDWKHSTLNSVFVDPESFHIADFKAGDYISISWSTNMIYGRIFPLKSALPSEIMLTKIFVDSFSISPDTLVSISEAPNFSLADSIIISSNIEGTVLLFLIDQIKSCLGVPRSKGMVVHGIAGTGKKSIVYKFCQMHALTICTFDCAEVSSLLTPYKHKMTADDIKNVVERTHGFVPADINNLIWESGNCACARIIEASTAENSFIAFNDFFTPLVEIKPTVIRDMLVYVPETSWADIGGMELVKASVKECLEAPWKNPEGFKRLSISPPSGVLLYGPPGCSKTMIARAIARDSGFNFISVRGPELVNKYVGETERSIRNLFKKARFAAPCVIFFDELDSFTSIDISHSNTTSEVNNRILGQLKTEIDGFSTQRGQVFVIGATNKPFSLDPSLIRCGRFDRLIYVPLPDPTSRKEIFKLKFSKMPVDPNIEIDILISKTHNFSGAEIVAACKEAAIASLREDINSPFGELKNCK